MLSRLGIDWAMRLNCAELIMDRETRSDSRLKGDRHFSRSAATRFARRTNQHIHVMRGCADSNASTITAPPMRVSRTVMPFSCASSPRRCSPASISGREKVAMLYFTLHACQGRSWRSSSPRSCRRRRWCSPLLFR